MNFVRGEVTDLSDVSPWDVSMSMMTPRIISALLLTILIITSSVHSQLMPSKGTLFISISADHCQVTLEFCSNLHSRMV